MKIPIITLTEALRAYPHIFDEMLHFFKVYKQLEGKETAVNEVMGHKAAVEIIKECIANYNEVYGEKYNNIDTGK